MVRPVAAYIGGRAVRAYSKDTLPGSKLGPERESFQMGTRCGSLHWGSATEAFKWGPECAGHRWGSSGAFYWGSKGGPEVLYRRHARGPLKGTSGDRLRDSILGPNG